MISLEHWLTETLRKVNGELDRQKHGDEKMRTQDTLEAKVKGELDPQKHGDENMRTQDTLEAKSKH